MAQDDEHRNSSISHILMIPYPSLAHAIPMLDLARQLASRSDILVTLVSFEAIVDSIAKEDLQSWGKDGEWRNAVRLIGVPDRPGFDPPEHLYPKRPRVMRESFQLKYNMEPLVDTLLQGGENDLRLRAPTCIVADMLNWWAAEFAAKLHVPRYTLVVLNALFIVEWASLFDEANKANVAVIPIRQRADLVIDVAKKYANMFQTFPEGSGDLFYERWSSTLRNAHGILLNSCLGLEAPVLDVLRVSHLVPKNIAMLAVGPLGVSFSNNSTLENLTTSEDRAIMEWLDQQPVASVLYVGFGTTGMLLLSKRHVFNLAQGLEASNQRFVWVLRAPPDLKDCAQAFPPRFEERVKGRAFLVKGWAPQKQILAHSSTGGFLSACGSNSAFESLYYGVPMIGWPSMADQPAVCTLVADILDVAISLPLQEKCMVEPEAISSAVNSLLQGEQGRAMRERAKECSATIIEALSDKGTAKQAMREFAEHIKAKLMIG